MYGGFKLKPSGENKISKNNSSLLHIKGKPMTTAVLQTKVWEQLLTKQLKF